MSMRCNLAICLALVAALALPARSSGTTLSEGSVAPALVAPTLDGAPFDLGALRGKVVLIHFWATWCPPCREEMPIIDRLYRDHHQEGLEVLAASIDDRHDRRLVVKFMRAFAFPAVLLSQAGTNGWGSPDVMPMTYLVDRDGVIRTVIRPSKQTLTVDRLEGLLKPLLHPTASDTR
jgi:cytochrome c biogenesis protein CcmG, thiol:disulfide interchange protein DsbE